MTTRSRLSLSLAPLLLLVACVTNPPVPPTPTPTPTVTPTPTPAPISRKTAMEMTTTAFEQLLGRAPDTIGMDIYSTGLMANKLAKRLPFVVEEVVPFDYQALLAHIRTSAEWKGLHPCGDEPCPHVDPGKFSLAELAAFRGSMWTARLDVKFGPRPGDDSNILAFGAIQYYSPAEQQRMIAAYKARGYKWVVTGPMVGECYHDQFPCNDTSYPASMQKNAPPTQAQWDAYLDVIEMLWDNDLFPVHFIKPDNWTLAQVVELLEPLYRQPRAQRLLRIIVPAGWEPTRYGWSSRTWGTFFDWGHQVLPNALIAAHTVTDVHAMVGTDEAYDDEFAEDNIAASWRYLTPKIHVWMVQHGGYVEMKSPTGRDIVNHDDLEFAAGYQTFLTNVEELHCDLKRRFHDNHMGWGSAGSLWGPDIPIVVIGAEYASWAHYWRNFPEKESIEIGNRLMKCADGYLDGGSVPVSVRRGGGR